MEIEEKTEGDVTILVLKGKMAGEDGADLREEVEDLVEEGRVNIVLDLDGVTYIDSACLGEIVLCHKTVSRNNGKLKLMNLSESLRTLLSRMRLLFLQDSD
jgi:anti-sigma B factor antagonist